MYAETILLEERAFLAEALKHNTYYLYALPILSKAYKMALDERLAITNRIDMLNDRLKQRRL